MKIRKLLSSATALIAAAALTACGGGGASTPTAGSETEAVQTQTNTTETQTQGTEAKEFTPMKIAVAVNSTDEAMVQAKNAMETVIGPALNIEFMFSEGIADNGALNTFIENAYASGADAVYTNVTGGIDQAAALCEDLGIYFVGISSADAEENMEMPHYIGVTGASAAGYGEAYAQALEAVLKDGEEHSVLILSGAASYGATSFIEATAGSLKALQDIYGLTYTQDIAVMATTSTQVEAENDKNIKITVFPGMQDMATNVSPLLQSGEYDVLVGTSNIYDSLGVAVDEVEKALGKDIKFISRSAFSDATKNAFNTKDSQGSPVMDAIVLNGAYENVAAVLMLRNAFDGYADNMRDGDRCSRVPGMIPLVVTSAEEYNSLSDGNMPYSFVTVEDLLSLCGPDVTFKDIDAFGASLTTENILEKF